MRKTGPFTLAWIADHGVLNRGLAFEVALCLSMQPWVLLLDVKSLQNGEQVKKLLASDVITNHHLLLLANFLVNIGKYVTFVGRSTIVIVSRFCQEAK